MAKKIGTYHKPGVAVPDDHPDGGTLHIFPMAATDTGAFQDEFNALRYVHDASGALVLVDGKPVQNEISIEKSIAQRIALVRKRCVAKITNLVNADDPVDENGNWKLIELTKPEEIDAFLGGTSMHLVEVEAKVTHWVEREVKTESFVPSADGGEPTRIVETRTVMVEEPVIENGKAMTEKKMLPANQRMFDYAWDRARALVSSKEAEAKNSSPTPAVSSD
jgi:hypothetical protein